MGEFTQQTKEQELLVEFHRLFEDVEPRSLAHEALVDQIMLAEARSRLEGKDTTPAFTNAAERIIRNTLLDNVRPDGYGAYAKKFAAAIFALTESLSKITQITHARPNIVDELHRANVGINAKGFRIEPHQTPPSTPVKI